MSYTVFTQSTDRSFVQYRGSYETAASAQEQVRYFKALGYAEAWVEEAADTIPCPPPQGCEDEA